MAAAIQLQPPELKAQADPGGQSFPADSYVFEDPPIWRQALGGAVIGAPATQVESVVMVSDGGNIKAFSWQGRPLWDYFARGRVQPFITRTREGTTYVCRSSNQNNGILIAINRAGRELWQMNLGEPLTAPVLTGWDGRLFIFTAYRIRCMTASGSTLWSITLDKKTALKPCLDEQGGFFLVLEDGELLRINAFGKIDSEKLDTIPVSVTPVHQGNNRYALLIAYSTGSLELLDTANANREIFRNITLPARPVAAAARENKAAFLLGNGRICLFSLAERRILWTGETHLAAADISNPNFETTFFFDERGIYALTRNGACAYADDGRRLWLIRIRGAASLPAFSDEGVLYSGGADWILYAYKLEERVRVQKRLLYGPAPEGSYGTGIKRPDMWSGYINRFTESEMDIWFREIELAIRQGQIGEKEIEYTSWLMEIAGSALGLYSIGARPPVQSPYRSRAVGLLSYMGSSETIPFLADLFFRETDPLVKTAAAQALGRIGVDPDGISMRAFSNAVFPPAPLRDEQVLTAIANAVGALCRFSGPPLSEPGIRILTALSSRERPPAVRTNAEREILSLRN